MSRSLLITALAVCVVLLRLGDVPCGCAEHSLWSGVAEPPRESACPGDHPCEPNRRTAFERGCSGECPPFRTTRPVGIDVPVAAESRVAHYAVIAVPSEARPHETRTRGRPFDARTTARLRAELGCLLA